MTWRYLKDFNVFQIPKVILLPKWNRIRIRISLVLPSLHCIAFLSLFCKRISFRGTVVVSSLVVLIECLLSYEQPINFLFNSNRLFKNVVHLVLKQNTPSIYSRNEIRKTENEHLNIVGQSLSCLWLFLNFSSLIPIAFWSWNYWS